MIRPKAPRPAKVPKVPERMSNASGTFAKLVPLSTTTFRRIRRK
jgi:hypothetical protein